MTLCGCSDVSGLSYLKNLENLNLTGNNISDISALSELKNLKKLDLCANPVKDITPLMGLSQLENLSFDKNNIPDSDIEKLKNVLPHCNIMVAESND